MYYTFETIPVDIVLNFLCRQWVLYKSQVRPNLEYGYGLVVISSGRLNS